MPSSLIWDIGFLAGTGALCIAYWLAARTWPDLRLARNFACLMMATCIASNLIPLLLPYPEGIKAFAPMDLATCYLALRCRGKRAWPVFLAFTMLAMLTLHAALWGPHLFSGRKPTNDELGRYFVILDVMYVIALLIVAFPGGRHVYNGIRATVSSRRSGSLQPITRV
jgi:hypothetical protein